MLSSMEKCQKYLLLWQRKIYNYSLTFLAKVIVFLLFCPTLIQFQYKPLLVYQKFKRFIVSLYKYHLFYIFLTAAAKCFTYANSSNFDNFVSEMSKFILKEETLFIQVPQLLSGRVKIGTHDFMTPEPMLENHAALLASKVNSSKFTFIRNT